MTRDVLIARLHYYACEDAAQGDVLNDVIALLQRDGEAIAALEADRDELLEQREILRHMLRGRRSDIDQLRAELAECRRDAEMLNWLCHGGWEVLQDPKYWKPDLKFYGAITAAMNESATK